MKLFYGIKIKRKKWLKIMRISCTQLLFIVLFAGMSYARSSDAQINMHQRVNITAYNVPISNLLRKIGKIANVKFVYSLNVVDVSQKATITATSERLDRVLNHVLVQHGIGYDVINERIVLSPLPEKNKDKNIPLKDLSASGIDLRIYSRITYKDGEILREVTGQVTDSAGTPLPGVTIYVKNNKSIGTTTDLNGRYVLEVPDHSTLVFSMVGFESQEISVNGRINVDVRLLPATNKLGETVVVAFGSTQKKEDVVGAVTTIDPQELRVPSSNLTTALAGRLAGIIAYQRTGEPGQNNANFFIRGVTTFGYKKDPLILIDNIEVTPTALARLQVDDIASFSILKDATATALYGARGANGVILIKTKEGVVGKAKYSIRIENSISSPTRNVQLADPVTYMKLANEAVLTRNPLGALPYTKSKIDHTIAGGNPYVYPVTDWMNELFKNYAVNQRADINISGGGHVARYYVSGTFSQDNGVLKVPKRSNFNNNINLKTYSLRTNVNINLSKSTELAARISGTFDDYTGPINGGSAVYKEVIHTDPVLFPAYFPIDSAHRFVHHILFGNYDQGQYNNPYADMVKGYKNYSASTINAQLEIKQDLNFITKGLRLRVLGNTIRYSYFDVVRQYRPFYYKVGFYDKLSDEYTLNVINETTGTEYLDYNEGTKTVTSSVYLQSVLSYDRTFGDKHTISGMLVGMLRNSLSGNAGDLQTSLPHRNLGLSGRLTYSYDDRYYIEFNFGYNGSERFSIDHRFGFFPSIGVAWHASREKFWQSLAPVISNLKLRATYGLVGNDAIGSPAERFFYLSNVNLNDGSKGATFGSTDNGYSRPGVTVSRYSNRKISWETAYKTNLGIDLGLFNDKINIVADFFKEYRTNILMNRAYIPSLMGLSAPVEANVGKAASKGIDGSIDYSQQISNKIWIQGRANFTYATSEYKVYEEPDYTEKYRSYVGYSIDQPRGYIAERLFVNDKEAANSPKQNFGPYGGGDIKYRDINDDGQITEADQVPIGFPTSPEIVYGFGISMGYGNFDLSCFFQGLARESFFIDAAATSPFQDQTQLLKVYADSHWSEDNQDIYALWPRLSPTVNQNDIKTSTWWLRNGEFLRLKQVEIGYSLPLSLMRKWRMNKVRIYLNATNLWCLSKFKLWDVEMTGNGLAYPIQRVVNIGVQLSF